VSETLIDTIARATKNPEERLLLAIQIMRELDLARATYTRNDVTTTWRTIQSWAAQ